MKLFSAISVDDARNFLRASPHIHRLIGEMLDAFNIPDHAFFFSELEAHRAIIGGDAALRCYPSIALPIPNQLHIYVQDTVPQLEEDEELWHKEAFAQTHYDMCQALGYRYFGTSVNSVTTFAHPASDKKIMFVDCATNPTAVITSVPTTLHMNFISSRTVNFLYPELTSRRTGLMTAPFGSSGYAGSQRYPMKAIDGLESSGFQHIDDVTDAIGEHQCRAHSSCPLTIREFPGLDLFIEHGYGEDHIGEIGSSLWKLRAPCACGSPDGGHNGYHTHLPAFGDSRFAFCTLFLHHDSLKNVSDPRFLPQYSPSHKTFP